MGATLSAATAPNPVPYRIITCPGWAGREGRFTGVFVAETESCKTPGPRPAPLMEKMPKLAAVTVARPGGLLILLKLTYTDTVPNGAVEGIMALICPGLTNTGIAFTVVLP